MDIVLNDHSAKAHEIYADVTTVSFFALIIFGLYINGQLEDLLRYLVKAYGHDTTIYV